MIRLDWMSYAPGDHIVIYASKLAACAGMHQYVDGGELKREFMNAMGLEKGDARKEVIANCLESLNPGDRAMMDASYSTPQDLQKSLELVSAAKFLREMPSVQIDAIKTSMGLAHAMPVLEADAILQSCLDLETLKEIRDNIGSMQAFEAIVAPKMSPLAPVAIDAIRSHMYTRNGKEQEDFIRKAAREDVKTSAKFRVTEYPLMTIEGIEVYLGGRHDGMVGDKIIEIKTRQRRFLGTPLYELVQVHGYMAIYGTKRATIIESYNGEQREHDIDFDVNLWGAVQSNLAAFLTDMFLELH